MPGFTPALRYVTKHWRPGMNIFLPLSILALVSLSPNARAGFFEWSSTELQYLHGDGYKVPGGNDIGQSIITFSHADGWAYGRNFLFMDTLMSDSGQPGQTNVYGEAYSYLSLSKLTGKDLSVSIVKDINATLGVNAGENFDSAQSGTRIFLYGVTVDFELPGFKLFTLDFLSHDVLEPVALGPSLQITPVWKLPFHRVRRIGRTAGTSGTSGNPRGEL